MFTISNNANLEAARIGFHAAFLEMLGVPSSLPFDNLYQQVPSSTSLEEWNWLGDVPDFAEWKGDRILKGLEAFRLRISNKDWASGIALHQNDFKDDKLGLIQTKVQQLADRARTHRSRLCIKALIAGMGTGAFPEVSNGLAYDGKNFFDTTHATGSNKQTLALDSAGLEAALILLQSQTSYDGVTPLELGMGQLTLIVGPKLASKAYRLQTSDYSGTTTSTDTNIWKGRLDVLVTGYLGSNMFSGTFDDWWFLADLTQPIKPFVFQLREEISTSAVMGGQNTTNDSVPRFKAGELWFGAEARYNVAPFEFRTMVGSQVA